MASSEVSKGNKMNFKKILETILSDAEIENLAQLSNGAEHFFESDYSDEENSVDDTLIDLANYCILMAGYLRAKREQERLNQETPLNKPVNFNQRYI